MPSNSNNFLDSASESDEEDEEEEYDPFDYICWVNQQEQDFFNDIAYGPFLKFHYKTPNTTCWNQPQNIRLRLLLYSYLDNNTLNRICPKKHIIEDGLATLDVNGEGNMQLSNDDIKTLFEFANRWCIIHKTKCISWVVFCIVQFSCI